MGPSGKAPELIHEFTYRAQILAPVDIGPGPFGHRYAGTVADVGPHAPPFEVGQPVMGVHSAPCLACDLCRKGRQHLCPEALSLQDHREAGFDTWAGGCMANQEGQMDHVAEPDVDQVSHPLPL